MFVHPSFRLNTLLMAIALMACTAFSSINTPTMASHEHPAIPGYSTIGALSSSEYMDVQKGSYWLEQGQPLKALPHFNRAVEKDPTNILALYNLAFSYDLLSEKAEELGDADGKRNFDARAEEVYNKILLQNPNLSIIYFKLGRLALERGSEETALQLYQQGIEIEPDNALFYFNLATLYDKREEADKAIEAYQQSIKHNPQFVYAYNNLGLLLEKNHQPLEAEKVYLKAIEIKGDYVFARLNLGNLYAEGERWAEAKEMYQSVLSYDPENAWANLYLGNIALQENSNTEAVAYYQRSLIQNPKHPMTYYMLAVAYNRLNRYDDALQVGLQYLILAPDSPRAPEMKRFVLSLRDRQIHQVSE